MAFDVASEREVLGVDIPVALQLDSCIAISYEARSEAGFALNPKKRRTSFLKISACASQWPVSAGARAWLGTTDLQMR